MIDGAAAAAFDDGVEDGAAVPGSGIADEEPVREISENGAEPGGNDGGDGKARQ